MASKIAHLSELESILCNNEKTNVGYSNFFSVQDGRFLGLFGSFKNKGVRRFCAFAFLAYFQAPG